MKIFTCCYEKDYNKKVIVPDEKFFSGEHNKKSERIGIKKMDVKEQITKAVDKITKDKKLQEQFQKEPVKALESVLGVDLPDDVVEQVIQGVKAKLTVDKVSGAVDTLKGFIKK